MNPLFHTEFSISDSLKNVRKSVLIYEIIIVMIFTPLFDSKTTCFLIGKALSPFIQMDPMKFLIGFHENISLIS